MGADPVTIALVGCGRISELVWMPLLARLGEVRVGAIAEADAERRKAAGARFPDAVALERFEDAFAVPGLDAALIALPNDLHAAAAIAAFDAGLHAYIEKPLALDPEEGGRVTAAARAAGRVGAIGFNFRFNPLYERSRELISAGRIGNPLGAHFTVAAAAQALPEWKLGRERGGGVMLDLGSHVADLSRFVFGSPVRSVAGGGGLEAAWLELELEGGVIVTSQLDHRGTDRDSFAARGTTGELSFDRFRSSAVRIEGRRPPLALANRIRRLRGSGYEPSYERAFRAFLAALHGSPQAAAADLDDGLRSLEVVSAAERAARQGTVIMLRSGTA